MKKRKYVLLFLLLFFCLITHAGKPIRVVVIDAGHGGKDPGAENKEMKLQEKTIALSVALNVGNKIKEAYPNIKVIYTRSTDVFIELNQRAKIANENHADLFISIHCNSAPNSIAYGTETFVMGMDKNNANLAVAQKENSAILMEANSQENYGNFDPTSDEAYIIFQLYQNAHSEQSIKFAKYIQDEFRTTYHRHDRGVKQAPLLVLWRTATPSVLVELGFISNKDEATYMSSQKGQEELSKSIFTAFSKIVKENNNYLPIEKNEEQENVVLTNIQKDTVFNVCYKVQFATLTTKLSLTDDKLKNLQDVEIEKISEKTYRYTSGHLATYKDAVNILEHVKNNGYKDAFIIAFDKNGKKITIAEAKKMEKGN